MTFMNRIIEYLNDASDFFYDLYLECYYASYIPNEVADLFYEICLVFNRLAWRFSDFNELLEDWEDEIADILSWSNIRSLIRGWLPDLEDTIDWWTDWWYWVKRKVDDWWDDVKVTVQGWIDIATEGLDSLRAEWDNFWTVTFPTLVSFTWLGIWWNSQLIELEAWFHSELQELVPFWEGWQDVKDKVVEFIDDPLEWLLGKFTDWFLGPEE